LFGGVALDRIVINVEMRRGQNSKIERLDLDFISTEVLRGGRRGCRQQGGERHDERSHHGTSSRDSAGVRRERKKSGGVRTRYFRHRGGSNRNFRTTAAAAPPSATRDRRKTRAAPARPAAPRQVPDRFRRIAGSHRSIPTA